jgi:hypothetical protein
VERLDDLGVGSGDHRGSEDRGARAAEEPAMGLAPAIRPGRGKCRPGTAPFSGPVRPNSEVESHLAASNLNIGLRIDALLRIWSVGSSFRRRRWAPIPRLLAFLGLTIVVGLFLLSEFAGSSEGAVARVPYPGIYLIDTHHSSANGCSRLSSVAGIPALGFVFIGDHELVPSPHANCTHGYAFAQVGFGGFNFTANHTGWGRLNITWLFWMAAFAYTTCSKPWMWQGIRPLVDSRVGDRHHHRNDPLEHARPGLGAGTHERIVPGPGVPGSCALERERDPGQFLRDRYLARVAGVGLRPGRRFE